MWFLFSFTNKHSPSGLQAQLYPSPWSSEEGVRDACVVGRKYSACSKHSIVLLSVITGHFVLLFA